MPKTIRIQVDRISADLAAQRLQQEGIPAQVVADSDWIGVAGVPTAFSLVVPAEYEQKARRILVELTEPRHRKR